MSRSRWLDGIAARIALWAILGLIGAQLLSVGVALVLRPNELRIYSVAWVADQVGEIARGVFERPPAERASFLRARAETEFLTLEWLTAWKPGDDVPRRGRFTRLQRTIQEHVPAGYAVVVQQRGERGRSGLPDDGQVVRVPPDGPLPGDPAFEGFVPGGFVVAVRGPDQSWLVVRAQPHAHWWGWAALAGWLVGIAVAAAAAASWAAHRVARPLEGLAREAGRASAGLAPDFAIAAAAPREVRTIASALGDMRGRLTRFVEDRTRMLAAISHDLRTPLTRLRLRAEGIGEREEQAKALADIDEMERMIAETLAFARADALDTAAERFDVAALVQTLVDERVDLGAAIGYEGPNSLVVEGRAGALKRALANLMDNAIGHGQRVDVSLGLAAGADRVDIFVRDDGPGIAAAEIENVFRPFYRVEGSRSRATGGAGLGLSVARDVARAHGGDIVLENREPHGLSARLSLPLTA